MEESTNKAQNNKNGQKPGNHTPMNNLGKNGSSISRSDSVFYTVETKPHAFVVMPFGKKKGNDGQVLDFNAIYSQLIAPALLEAGFTPFRADEETVSGDILTDMFQELLLADLVLCDMSIDNANVFYELGIRHAFRKRGVIHIQAGRAYMPFDIFNVRTIPYHTIEEGVPDPEYLEKDLQTIARVARDTWASDRDAVHSPVYNLLSGLEEPDRRQLRTPLATGFWREYNDWRERVTIAQRQKRIGDILLLTEEITNPLIKEEALGEAGKALQTMGRYHLALDEYRKGIEINPKNMEFRREEAFHLNRLGRLEEAIVKLEAILEKNPKDSEAIVYLARIYKDMWIGSWRNIEDEAKRSQTAFAAYHWLIKSIQTYLKGFRLNLNEHYPGINALTLSAILVHLASQYDNPEDPDPDISQINEMVPRLKETLLFSFEQAAQDEQVDYWTLVSLAELQVTSSTDKRNVTRAYRKAFTTARKNSFFLLSSLNQLKILEALNIREEYVQAGIDAIQDELARISGKENNYMESEDNSQPNPDNSWVLLFSGYAIDREDDPIKRFPAEEEDTIKDVIDSVLNKYQAGSNDLGILTGLACGSDIIFAEACIARNMQIEVHLAIPEAMFINNFVSPGGDRWVERYYQLRSHPNVSIFHQSEQVGKPRDGMDPFLRNNRWALYSAMVNGREKMRLVAVWDGKPGIPEDFNGKLVAHQVENYRQMGGVVEQINSSKLLPDQIGEFSAEEELALKIFVSS